MKALVHTAPYVMELQEWDVPTCGTDDILIRVKACAICGSDIKGYSGKTGRRQPPSSWAMRRRASSRRWARP